MWTASGWLQGMIAEDDNDVPIILQILAKRLVPFESDSELKSLRDLWEHAGSTKEGGRNEIIRRLQEGDLITELADVIAAELEVVASREFESAYDVHSRFYQEGGTLLFYAGLNTFYGGLESVVGKPWQNFGAGLEHEHRESHDSKHEWVTKNYGVHTTSEIEFLFVDQPGPAQPDDPRLSTRGQAWPKEEKLMHEPDWEATKMKTTVKKRWEIYGYRARDASRMRTPLSREALQERVNQINAKLTDLPNEKELIFHEAVCARLYTGPMFEKCATLLNTTAPVV